MLSNKNLSALIARVTMKGSMILLFSAVAHSASKDTIITDEDWCWFYERMGTQYVPPLTPNGSPNHGQVVYDGCKSTKFNFLGNPIDVNKDDNLMSTPAGAHWLMNTMTRQMGARLKPQSFAWAEQVFGNCRTKEVQTEYGPMMFYAPDEEDLEKVRSGARNVTNIHSNMNSRTRSDGVREMYNGDLRVDTTDGAMNSQIARGLQGAIPGISSISTFGGSRVRAKPVQSRGMTPLMGPSYHPDLGAFGIKRLDQPAVAKPKKPVPLVLEQAKKDRAAPTVYGWGDFACQNSKKPPKVIVHFYDENDVKYICEPKIVIGKKDGTIRLNENKDSARMREPNAKRIKPKRIGYKKKIDAISETTHELIHNETHDYYVIRKRGTNSAAAEFAASSEPRVGTEI